MYINIVALFVTSLFSGLLLYVVPNLNIQRFKMLLNFSGAYLFSITVIHILPELFGEPSGITMPGIFVLAGFFLQMILEYFSSGVEHGHIHVHAEEVTHVPYSILVSLGLHSFLEGSLLVHPAHSHNHGSSSTLLFGLLLHKIPECFALMSILIFRLGKTWKATLLLVLYSMTSPLGLGISHLIYNSSGFNTDILTILFAIIAGNFLYISTTIFFETTPNHQFKLPKLMTSVFGAAVAIAAEFYLNN